ncbi:MAG: hypothetical protein JO040_00700 [Gemmatimonadetes bacterium]|nr:hypothetical protein [Gemmatimonadota bacterium]
MAQIGSGGVEALHYEVAQEKAYALARMSGRLQEALRALEAFDTAHAGPLELGLALERKELVAAAGEALWFYVVQREVCGLRDNEAVLRELRVPREVRLRMGLNPSRRGTTP